MKSVEDRPCTGDFGTFDHTIGAVLCAPALINDQETIVFVYDGSGLSAAVARAFHARCAFRRCILLFSLTYPLSRIPIN